jgi:GNAT superfamily N-acetyltransferase
MQTERGGWQLKVAVDRQLEDELTEQLVEFNKSRSPAVEERFQPGNLASEPVQVYALDDTGRLVGGCTARIEAVWHWLTIETMWVDPDRRGLGLGSALLAAVEELGRQRGCRWSDVTTFDFQAPGFYSKAGYAEYAVKHDYPPGHSNHFLRKDL